MTVMVSTEREGLPEKHSDDDEKMLVMRRMFLMRRRFLVTRMFLMRRIVGDEERSE